MHSETFKMNVHHVPLRTIGKPEDKGNQKTRSCLRECGVGAGVKSTKLSETLVVIRLTESVARAFRFPKKSMNLVLLPPKDGRGFRDFYHNYTNSILQQLKRKFWKIPDALFRIS